jgi:hypothetical protein
VNRQLRIATAVLGLFASACDQGIEQPTPEIGKPTVGASRTMDAQGCREVKVEIQDELELTHVQCPGEIAWIQMVFHQSGFSVYQEYMGPHDEYAVVTAVQPNGKIGSSISESPIYDNTTPLAKFEGMDEGCDATFWTLPDGSVVIRRDCSAEDVVFTVSFACGVRADHGYHYLSGRWGMWLYQPGNDAVKGGILWSE